MSSRSSAMAAAVCLGLGSAETVQQELADMPYADVETVIIGLPSAQRNAMTRPWTSEKFAKAWQPPFPSAFSADEISVLREWVAEGGGLALVYDHKPVSDAVEELAAAFGVEVANGHAYDERELRWEGDSLSRREAGTAVFRRIDGTLAVHPITDGRGLAELIDLASLTWVPAEEDSLYAEIAEIFRADVPVTFLHPMVDLTVAHKRLRGLSSPWRVEPVAHMQHLWIEG